MVLVRVELDRVSREVDRGQLAHARHALAFAQVQTLRVIPAQAVDHRPGLRREQRQNLVVLAPDDRVGPGFPQRGSGRHRPVRADQHKLGPGARAQPGGGQRQNR